MKKQIKIVRTAVNPYEVRESKDRKVTYEFACYRGKKEVVGQYESHKMRVKVDAYGMIVYRVIHHDEGSVVHDFDLGFLSAKNTEIYYLMNKLVRARITTFTELMNAIRNECRTWPDYYSTIAKRQVQKELGLLTYNPLRKAQLKQNKKTTYYNWNDSGRGIDI